MSDKILFLGGPNDGKRMLVPPSSHTIVMPVFTTPNRCPSNVISASFGFTTHTFAIKELRLQNGTTAKIAVHSSIKDPLEQLVRGYRYHRKQRYRRK